MSIIRFKLNGINYEGLMLINGSVDLFKKLFKNQFNYKVNYEYGNPYAYGVDTMDYITFTIYDRCKTRNLLHGDLIAWKEGAFGDIDKILNEDTDNDDCSDIPPYIIIPYGNIDIIKEKQTEEEPTEKSINIDTNGNIVW